LRFTILGANGFIGSALVNYLQSHNYEVITVGRDVVPEPNFNYGHVIYAIGLTGDFRLRSFDTVQSHVIHLMDCLQSFKFESFLYLSSTRIFGVNNDTNFVNESTPAFISPSADSIYDLSKLLGEALCLAQKSKKIRIVRISNVYGPRMSTNTFLGSIISSIRSGGVVELFETSNSAKDYLNIEDLVFLLPQISLMGSKRLYLVASGYLVEHERLLIAFRNFKNFKFIFSKDAIKRRFSLIDISMISNEFNFKPRHILNDVASLLEY
jgi:nucleoside-diphosphate-sugar epimerase